ncbi:FAD-binding protein [Parahaliea sp. F7430]|uniref:FAD-binding protein n=1 Tax=Sediminihaliea albiluteola TaxID=2758564 RepID=A0A7W2YIN6_9GAMM|nr:D-arabinono-1,4-lactone oxidase [Sediminihaliea albiluteola]MBA6411694.1 FAD-binding protein [Sediminihaliea albiluteola]
MTENKLWSRRRVIAASCQLSAALLLSPALATAQQASTKRRLRWQNWAGNQKSLPQHIAVPRSEDDIIKLLRDSSGEIRPMGSGHSWSGLVPSDGTLLSLDRLKGLISHDANTLQAEVWSGTKLFAYGPMMAEIDQAIINMSDINYQSMAGAISTSTHGTGNELGCISSFVSELQLITPDGESIRCSAEKNTDLFNAARNGLGVLGVITRLRFQNREKHRLHQQTWLADIEATLDNIEQLNRDNEQFELFPLPNSDKTLVVVTNPAQAGAADQITNNPDALADMEKLFNLSNKLPALSQSVYNMGLEMAVRGIEHRIGPSYDVLAHPRTTLFIEMEYTVPADLGVDCLREVLQTIRDKAPEVAFPLEYRYVKGDDTMIGMFSDQDGCSISVHQFAKYPKWRDYLATIEPVFWKYGGRPHWGKWHSLTDQSLASLYPNWQQFKTIRQELDPKGRMLNSYLRELLGEA